MPHRQTRENGHDARSGLAAIRSHENVNTATVDRAEQRQAAAAGTRTGLWFLAAIADAIANQRIVGIQQAGADEFAIFANLDIPEFRPLMQPAGGAFARARTGLRHSVRLECRAMEGCADEPALDGWKWFGFGIDCGMYMGSVI